VARGPVLQPRAPARGVVAQHDRLRGGGPRAATAVARRGRVVAYAAARAAGVHRRRPESRRAGPEPVAQPEGAPEEAPPEGRPRELPEAPALRGLRRGRLERLDRGSSGIRSILLSRRLLVPAGGSPERHQPRHSPNDPQLGDRGCAQSLLCAHLPRADLDALHRRGTQDGAQGVPGHVCGRMRVPIE